MDDINPSCEGLMSSIQSLLLSEEITRIMGRCFHSRILPFLKSSKDAERFAAMSKTISEEGIAYNTVNKRKPEDQGFILTNNCGFSSSQRKIRLTKRCTRPLRRYAPQRQVIVNVNGCSWPVSDHCISPTGQLIT